MDPLNITIVTLLVAAAILIDRADKADFFATRLFTLRMRLSRRIPVGRHVVRGDGNAGVGRPETSMWFKMPLPTPGGARVLKYTGVTDAETRFVVDGEEVKLDHFLEIYDEASGVLEVLVPQVGRISEMSIDRREGR